MNRFWFFLYFFFKFKDCLKIVWEMLKFFIIRLDFIILKIMLSLRLVIMKYVFGDVIFFWIKLRL